MKKIKVLFVCLGNICRSPTAHGVFAKLVFERGLDELIEVESAGTHAYHVGKSPDKRSQAVALKRGVDLSALRGRKVSADDFEYYDYILAMDASNLSHLRQECPVEFEGKLKLFLGFAAGVSEQEVPDPYYGGSDGFDYVMDLVESASLGLIEVIRKEI